MHMILYIGGANVDGPILRQLLGKRISLLPSTLRTRDAQVHINTHNIVNMCKVGLIVSL